MVDVFLTVARWVTPQERKALRSAVRAVLEKNPQDAARWFGVLDAIDGTGVSLSYLAEVAKYGLGLHLMNSYPVFISDADIHELTAQGELNPRLEAQLCPPPTPPAHQTGRLTRRRRSVKMPAEPRMGGV